MSSCEYYIVDKQDKSRIGRREVSLEQSTSGGVRIMVNGVRVAVFADGTNYLGLWPAESEITGLENDDSGFLKVDR